jgi:hypothetical protein
MTGRTPPEGYISTTEAGRRVGKSGSTIRTWAEAGELDFVRGAGGPGAGYMWVKEEDIKEREEKKFETDELRLKHYTERILQSVDTNRQTLEANQAAMRANQETALDIIDRLVQGQQEVAERLDKIVERLDQSQEAQESYQKKILKLVEKMLPSQEGGNQGTISVSLP